MAPLKFVSRQYLLSQRGDEVRGGEVFAQESSESVFLSGCSYMSCSPASRQCQSYGCQNISDMSRHDCLSVSPSGHAGINILDIFKRASLLSPSLVESPPLSRKRESHSFSHNMYSKCPEEKAVPRQRGNR